VSGVDRYQGGPLTVAPATPWLIDQPRIVHINVHLHRRTQA
jgi:hypothetical protein